MKYSGETITELCKLLEQGNGRVDSCILVGLHYDTFTEWMRGRIPEKLLSGLNDEETKEKKSEFSDAVKRAETKAKQGMIDIIIKAAPKQWQAAAWYLERKFPNEYAQRLRTDHSGFIESGREESALKEMRNGVKKYLDELHADIEAKKE